MAFLVCFYAVAIAKKSYLIWNVVQKFFSFIHSKNAEMEVTRKDFWEIHMSILFYEMKERIHPLNIFLAEIFFLIY